MPVPFPDEPFSQNLKVVEYQPGWAIEGAEMAAWLARSLPGAEATDHIGSTSVPGLPAKDCIDLMVRVESLPDTDLRPLANAGYRERPEQWNRVETLGTTEHPKRVFAPPVGGRSVNIHVREARNQIGTQDDVIGEILQSVSAASAPSARARGVTPPARSPLWRTPDLLLRFGCRHAQCLQRLGADNLQNYARTGHRAASEGRLPLSREDEEACLRPLVELTCK